MTAAAIAIATIACAAAGYMIGHRQDSNPAPPAVTVPGDRTNAQADDPATSPTDAARKRGYDKAFASARKAEFGPAFARAYREAYTNVFEAAGLTPPKDIPLPKAGTDRAARGD